MNRKILFVCYDGYRTTNARVRCYRFAKELKKNKIKADVFSFKDNLNASYDGQLSYKVNMLERFWLLFRATMKLIKEERSTVFYIQKAGFFAIAPYLVHLIKGNDFILDYDDYEYEQSIISKHLLRLLAKRAKFCVSASHYLQEFLQKFNPKVYYIPTGVDLKIFCGQKNKSKDVIFTWIGMIVDKEALQNVLFIVNNFKDIDVRLEIVGGGELMQAVKNQISKLNNKNIVYKGVIAPDEVQDYLSTVDVGIFYLKKDSRYNKSKSPTKLFEYMAMRLAIISTDIGEAKYIIHDKVNGLIANTKAEFVDSVNLLSKNPRLRLSLGKESLKIVKKDYNLEVLGKRLSKILSAELNTW